MNLRNSISLLICLATFGLASSVATHAAVPAAPDCPHTTNLHLDDVHHGVLEGVAGASFLGRIEVPAAGVVAIDVLRPLGRRPRIDGLRLSLETDCHTDGAWTVIDRAPGALVVRALGSGVLVVRVTNVSPQGTTLPFDLHVTFGAERTTPDAVTILDVDPPERCGVAAPAFAPVPGRAGFLTWLFRDAEPTRDVEPDECDVLEGPIAAPGVVIVEATGTPLRARLFAGTTCTAAGWRAEAWLDEGPLVASVQSGDHRLVFDGSGGTPMAYNLAVQHIPLCRVQDDHSALDRCATTLEPSMPTRGWLSPGDEDAFAITLDDHATVSLATEGDERLIGALLDEAGLSLPLACGDGVCTLTTALPAGRYVLRLGLAHGHTATAYTVRLGLAR